MAELQDGRSEQVCHSPVSQYGGSKPEVVNKNIEKFEFIESPLLH